MIGAVFLGVGQGLSCHTVYSVLRMGIHVRVRGVVCGLFFGNVVRIRDGGILFVNELLGGVQSL